MRWAHETQNKLREMSSMSLDDIANTIMDLEEKVNNLETELSDSQQEVFDLSKKLEAIEP